MAVSNPPFAPLDTSVASPTQCPQASGSTLENINLEKLLSTFITTFTQLITEQNKVLDAGFTRMEKQNKEQAEIIQKAVEGLKPQVPTSEAATDTKTSFWNTYKKIADEYDNEFLKKYGTDLDTSLIFAGLFSAVDSAFIIQIQPEIQMIPPPPKIILVAQSILYVSLFSTLLAALLASGSSG
ncbi:hypothetical protein B0H13DRAFT_2361642 [Mycena leptocephala]|nr:hypothetical protein B0H13DRAFT_2361642 [Mycena leptocephala]